MFNTKNLRGQNLLFRCLETGFVTTAPALTRYQQGRGIEPSRGELAGKRPCSWIGAVPTIHKKRIYTSFRTLLKTS